MRLFLVLLAFGVILVGLAGCGAEQQFQETGHAVNLMPLHHELP
jgi:hypothetical protein